MPTKRIKRYDPQMQWVGNRTKHREAIMVERPNGQFVHHADYAKLEERVLALQDHCPHTYGRMYPNNECSLCGKVV